MENITNTNIPDINNESNPVNIRPMSISVPSAIGKVSVKPGDTIRVTVNAKYKPSPEFKQELEMSLYYTTLGIKDPLKGCQVVKEFTFPTTTVEKTIPLTFDLKILSSANGGPNDGTYGAAVWFKPISNSLKFGLFGIPANNADNVVEISGNPKGLLGSIGELIPALLSVMVMSMMMNMMGGAMSGGSFDQGGYAQPYSPPPYYPPPQISVSRPPYYSPPAPYYPPPAPYYPPAQPEIRIIPG